MSLWQRIKGKLKRGFTIRLFGLSFYFCVSRNSLKNEGAKQNVLAVTDTVPKPTHKIEKPKQNSPTLTDTFKNDFQFNMFVEHALDINVKKTIISQLFYRNVGYYPNIDNPKTFAEKVLWLKLYYEDPKIEKACDKVLGKEYIDSVLGEGYTVPILKVFDSVHDIKLDELPNRFALKVNWATGCNIIVKDKSKLDMNNIRAQLDRWTLPWKCSYYGSFNAGYKNVKATIYAEQYLDIPNNSTEYKVFCFNGKAEFVLLELDYFGKEPARAYYDRDFKEVPWQFGKIKKVKVEQKPQEYDEMIRLAEKLAEPFPYIRVDFYDINGKLYIGELTFYSGGGLSPLLPSKYDAILGKKLDLTEAMKKVEYIKH